LRQREGGVKRAGKGEIRKAEEVETADERRYTQIEKKRKAKPGKNRKQEKRKTED
jgi:hypothetical protein